MSRVLLVLLISLTGTAPASALAAGWATAGRVEVLTPRVEPLTVVVRDQQSRVEVTETATARVLAVPSDVLFAFDSATVTTKGAAALRELAPQVAGGAVTVVGHTDARGDDAYNERLATRRADAVADVLRTAADGIEVETSAMGERAPVASNRTAHGRRRNRRVELVVPRQTAGS